MTHEDMVQELRTAAHRIGCETGGHDKFARVVLFAVARMLDKEQVTMFAKACSMKTLRGLLEDVMDGRTLLDWCRDEHVELHHHRRREGIVLAYSLADDAIRDVLTQLEAHE